MCLGLSAVALVFCFVLCWTLMDGMGQIDSHPLNIVLVHFKEVRTRAHNLGGCEGEENVHILQLRVAQRGPFINPMVIAVEERVFQKAQGLSPLYISLEEFGY